MMAAISGFDIRTVLMCHMLMACVFGVVLGGMHFAYPNLRGLGLLSLGFLAGLPGAVLVALRGQIPYWISVVVGNTLVHICYLLFYCGTLYFLDGAAKVSKLRFALMSFAVVVTAGVLAYYSLVDDRIVVRIVAVSLLIGFQYGLLAFDLWKRAAGRTRMLLFSGFVALFALLNVGRAILTLIFGSNPDLMKAGGIQVWSVLLGVIFTTGIGIFFLVSVAAELRSAVELRALHDLLTNTLNRAGIEERLEAELERSRRNDLTFCAALIDLDYFKLINDSGGHAAGDDALRRIAKAIKTGLRSYDVLGRYGGDEFLLLLPDTSVKEACAVLHRLRQDVSGCEVPANVWVDPERSIARFTISAGVAEFVQRDSLETLIARSDGALYDAKRAGRDCVRYRLAEEAVGLVASGMNEGSGVNSLSAQSEPAAWS